MSLVGQVAGRPVDTLAQLRPPSDAAFAAAGPGDSASAE